MLVRMQSACIYIALLFVLLKIGALYAVRCGPSLPPCSDGYCCKITCIHYNTGECVSAQGADCLDVRNAGFNTSGVYQVLTWLTHTCVKVYCDMDTDGGGWTVFQRRIDGSLSFIRNWSEYENGFGNLDVEDEYWLGLSIIQEMADRDETELRITVTNVNGITFYRQFGMFSLISDSYILNLDGPFSGDPLFHPNPLYELLNHNGTAFSTCDVDNDRNCAAISACTGWWFKRCFTVQLNGVYAPPGIISIYTAADLYYAGIIHTGFAPDKWSAFKYSTMMLRLNE